MNTKKIDLLSSYKDTNKDEVQISTRTSFQFKDNLLVVFFKIKIGGFNLSNIIL